MSENLKNGAFPGYKYVQSVQFEKKIRTIRTFRTILGLQNKKSVQSVHFGHPVYRLYSTEILDPLC